MITGAELPVTAPAMDIAMDTIMDIVMAMAMVMAMVILAENTERDIILQKRRKIHPG